MKNGVATSWDTPNGLRGVGDLVNPDWRATIKEDRFIRPNRSTGVRIIAVEDVHETGTGSWTYLLGYSCANGRVAQVFRLSGQTVRLVDTGNQRIRATLFLRSEGYSAVSPGKLVTLDFAWDNSNLRYRRIE
jgi:hypothetical protein